MPRSFITKPKNVKLKKEMLNFDQSSISVTVIPMNMLIRKKYF